MLSLIPALDRKTPGMLMHFLPNTYRLVSIGSSCSFYFSNSYRLSDAGRLFYTDTTNSMKKDAMVPVLKSFTQV